MCRLVPDQLVLLIISVIVHYGVSILDNNYYNTIMEIACANINRWWVGSKFPLLQIIVPGVDRASHDPVILKVALSLPAEGSGEGLIP